MAVNDSYYYQAPDMTDAYAAQDQGFSANDYSHHRNKRWYVKYRSWADYWRDVAGGALLGTSTTAPTDPLAQLQQQLLGKYEATKVSTAFAPNYDFKALINARNKGGAAQLQQKAAGMGMANIYQPTIDAASQARQTLVNQSMAAYRPQAYAQNQAYQNQQDQLLEALAKAQTETYAQVKGAGRSSG